MARILLVEDDANLGVMMSGLLESAGHATVWARDLSEATTCFSELPPDLVLLDLMLPDGNGLGLLRDIRRLHNVPVLIVTARGQGEDKVLGLDLGADDYLVKPFWNEELLARVRALLRRGSAPGPDTPRPRAFGAVVVDPVARRVLVAGEVVRLTPTEFDLLFFLLERAGRAIRREEICAAVLRDEEGGEAALQSHVSRLRAKLGADGERLRTVWGIGYLLDAGARHG